MELHSCRDNVPINHNYILSYDKMTVQTGGGIVTSNKRYYDQ